MYMHKDSLLATPPPVPIPDRHELPPLNAFVRPTLSDAWHVNKTFKASCELWAIVIDFLPLYYNGKEQEDMDFAPLTGRVKDIYKALLAWMNKLPEELKTTQDAFPHILNLQ